MGKITYMPAGDQGIVMHFGDAISEQVNQQIRGVVKRLRERPIRGVLEVIPSFTSLLVLYDSKVIRFEKLLKKLRTLEQGENSTESATRKIHKIPVCYEGEYGADLSQVAEHAGISKEDVINRHSGRDYLIYMLGFLPGFVYLGGMDESIFCPRLDVPRTRIPAGSVGIGGEQTGIYPLVSPGGWRLIGRTPVKVYDSKRDPSILYEMGEYIRFVPISSQEYTKIEEQVNRGIYQHEMEVVSL